LTTANRSHRAANKGCCGTKVDLQSGQTPDFSIAVTD
jgi:hypothetical protein